MHRIFFFLIFSFSQIGHFYFGKSGHFHVALTGFFRSVNLLKRIRYCFLLNKKRSLVNIVQVKINKKNDYILESF